MIRDFGIPTHIESDPVLVRAGQDGGEGDGWRGEVGSWGVGEGTGDCVAGGESAGIGRVGHDSRGAGLGESCVEDGRCFSEADVLEGDFHQAGGGGAQEFGVEGDGGGLVEFLESAGEVQAEAGL